MPRWARRCTGRRLTSSPCSCTRAVVGPEHAEHAVEERRLAGAVRADQPDALALLDREVEVVEGDDAGERLADVGGLERRRSRCSPPRACGSASASGVAVVIAAPAAATAPTSASVRRAACRLPFSTRPSGWRANWMVPSPKRMNRHCGDTVQRLGDAALAAEDPLEERAVQHDRLEEAEGDTGLDGPLDGARPEGDHEHQPEQRRERREVARVVDVLLVDAQHRAAEAGDEPGDGEGDRAGLGRPRCRSTGRPARCPARPGACWPDRALPRIWITASDGDDEDDDRRARGTPGRRRSPTARAPVAAPGCPGAARCSPPPTHESFTMTESKK